MKYQLDLFGPFKGSAKDAVDAIKADIAAGVVDWQALCERHGEQLVRHMWRKGLLETAPGGSPATTGDDDGP